MVRRKSIIINLKDVPLFAEDIRSQIQVREETK